MRFRKLWQKNHLLSINTILKSYRFPSVVYILFSAIILASCSPVKRFTEYESTPGKFIESGIASWYGPNFHGNLTANGEIYDMNKFTAAHKTLPFNSIVRVSNEINGESVVVRINDRGPYVGNRIIDLSRSAAESIDMIESGTANVKIYLLSDSELPNDIKKENFTIQIGSFLKRSDASELASSVRNSRIVEAIVNGERYFRVYVGKFSTISKAESHLLILKKNGLNGFVKQEEN